MKQERRSFFTWFAVVILSLLAPKRTRASKKKEERPQDTLPWIYYNNEQGERYVPTQQELRECADPPEGFNYMVSQFPLEVHETHLRLNKDERGRVTSSERICEFTSTYREEEVLLLLKEGYSLADAILLSVQRGKG